MRERARTKDASPNGLHRIIAYGTPHFRGPVNRSSPRSVIRFHRSANQAVASGPSVRASSWPHPTEHESGASQEFQNVAVGIAKIDSTPTMPIVNLHVLTRPGCASIFEPGVLDTAKDPIKLAVTNVERVVMPFQPLAAIEIES